MLEPIPAAEDHVQRDVPVVEQMLEDVLKERVVPWPIEGRVGLFGEGISQPVSGDARNRFFSG